MMNDADAIFQTQERSPAATPPAAARRDSNFVLQLITAFKPE
jgi:hypothetical protein